MRFAVFVVVYMVVLGDRKGWLADGKMKLTRVGGGWEWGILTERLGHYGVEVVGLVQVFHVEAAAYRQAKSSLFQCFRASCALENRCLAGSGRWEKRLKGGYWRRRGLRRGHPSCSGFTL